MLDPERGSGRVARRSPPNGPAAHDAHRAVGEQQLQGVVGEHRAGTRTWPGWLVGEDMPQATNRVTLNHDVLDQFGQPVPNVNFDDHPNDVAMREHAWQQSAALYESVGAIRTVRTPPYPATHNIGTARMSERPEDGVVKQVRPGPRRGEPVRLRRQP